jgi:hypothetical protein
MKEESLDATQANAEREWIGRARALKPLLEAAAPRIEQAKMMPPDVLHALYNAQMFRMTTPRSVGGAELDLATYAQVVATIAEGDASTAWCIAQVSGSSMCAAYLDPSVAQEIFGDAKCAFTWGFAGGQPCRAVPVQDGWIVNELGPLRVAIGFASGLVVTHSFATRTVNRCFKPMAGPSKEQCSFPDRQQRCARICGTSLA